jgi:hypothetical protein
VVRTARELFAGFDYAPLLTRVTFGAGRARQVGIELDHLALGKVLVLSSRVVGGVGRALGAVTAVDR